METIIKVLKAVNFVVILLSLNCFEIMSNNGRMCMKSSLGSLDLIL